MAAKKKTLKFWIGQLHLWLGLASGILVVFLGITGCILAFEQEIRNVTEPYKYTAVQSKPLLPPTRIKAAAEKAMPGKHPHSVGYEPGKSSTVVYYSAEPEYYYIVYVNPYTAEVLKVKDMSWDFFRIVVDGHFYLWLPPTIGQPIVATCTLIFVILLITGIVLWWPKNRAARKQRFSVKLNAKWRRVNYDMHNVLGFYMTWVIIFIALTGLVWGFQWFAKSVYWVSSGGKQQTEFYESFSDSTLIGKVKHNKNVTDLLWERTVKEMPGFKGSLDVHFPENSKSVIEIAANPDPGTYWKTDYRFYDQYTLKEVEVKHAYGHLDKASVADKISRMNYDIHVGAVLGITGKVIAFFGSLICASMPVTGFIIWWGRRKKRPSTSRIRRKPRLQTVVN
ncbi:MAG: PepSY domain-containing protein [Sphingobacteriaceae bacterium]|nr:MAG: PepSY domain-containing protein [Sphingobacteriaceae bacterium]